MSISAISGFTAGSYKGDQEGLADKIGAWLDTNDQRSAVRVVGVVKTKIFDQLYGCCQYAHVNTDIALIYGESGVGKTVAVRQYVQDNPGSIYVLMDPSSGDPRSFVGRLYRTVCNSILRNNQATIEAVDAVVDSLMNAGRLLVIDEAQHMSFKSIEILRRLHDEAHLGIVLVGHTSLYGKLYGGGSSIYAQTYSRIGLQRYVAAVPPKEDVRALYSATIGGDPDADVTKQLVTIAQQPGAMRTVTKVLRAAGQVAAAQSRPIQAQDVRHAASFLCGVQS
jgi:hypothetical protein